MKSFLFAGVAMFTMLTAVEPIWADDSVSAVRANVSDEAPPMRLSDLDMHLNPQIGVSNFEYSGNQGSGKSKFTGGATVEFGGAARKFETGLLIMQTGADATLNNGTAETVNVTYLTLPMMAKLRVAQMGAQMWYAKFGALTALQVGSSDRNITNGADVMLAAGLGGRFQFTKKADFIVEATYDKGLLESIHTASTTSYNQGFVVMAGLSFSI